MGKSGQKGNLPHADLPNVYDNIIYNLLLSRWI